MNRIIASLIALTLFIASPLAASQWTPIAEKFASSVYFLEAVNEQDAAVGGCSGFTINQEKRYVLTAAHCDGYKVRIAGTPSLRMFKDERKDLMVLRALSLDLGPAIKLARNNPVVGDEVASLGYGFALEQPMFRVAHISHAAIDIEELSGPFVMVDAQFVPGQSGGPVLNQQGELVSIVQRGGSGLGFGVGVETIRSKAGRYFEPSK